MEFFRWYLGLGWKSNWMVQPLPSSLREHFTVSTYIVCWLYWSWSSSWQPGLAASGQLHAGSRALLACRSPRMVEPEPGWVMGSPGLPLLPEPSWERGISNLPFHLQPCWEKRNVPVLQLCELPATSSTEACGRMLLTTLEKSNKMLQTNSVKKMFYLKC